MADRRLRWPFIGAAVVLSLTLAGGVWLAIGGRAAEPVAEPKVPQYELRVKLGRVRGHSASGRVPGKRLGKRADEIRRTMTGLYSAAFVDPGRWAGGRFPGLFAYFSKEARPQARRDVEKLTLGPSVQHVMAVRPEEARLSIRFVLGRHRRPVAALASMRFEGTGMAEKEDVAVRHEGEYVLRRTRKGWIITSYDVKGKIPPPEKARKARFSPGFSSRKPLFVLAIGSDARRGQSVSRTRADSLHIIGVDPRTRRASIVGIPRDSYVPIPGVGTRKINEALFYGGPELTVRTVERLTGINIDAYLLTGFGDFRRMVDKVGGIQTRIPYRMSDAASEAFFRPGKKRLSGRQALAFSRNRHDAPGGDFGRSLNQGRLIVSALGEFRKDLSKHPGALIKWVVAGAWHVKTDLGLGQMVELLHAAASLEPRRIKDRVVAGSGATVGGASVVRLGGAAQATFRDLRKDAWLGGKR